MSMFGTLVDEARELVSGARAHEAVRTLARHHRVQSSPGYDDAAAWLCARLREIGLEPAVEEVPGDGRTRALGWLLPEGWECRRATATLIAGDRRARLCDYAESKLSLILRSESARGRHRIVALEDGSEARHYEGKDVADAIVLTGGPVHRVHQLAVLERGAAGLLSDGRRLVPPVRTRFDDPDSLAYTSFWWNGEQRGWGFVVSPRAGDELRTRLARGESLELEVDIESRRFATPIPLVTAALPGETEEELIIVSHLCHPEPSANDNASGVAAALETVAALKGLADRGRRLKRGIRWLWMPEFTGTYAWFAAAPERARRLVAGVNLDMVGESQERCGSVFLIERPPAFLASFSEEVLAAARAATADRAASFAGPAAHAGIRMAEIPYSGGSDHAILNDPGIGVPCAMLIQWPDRFYHSSFDTPDKTDPASLAHAARATVVWAATLASGMDEALVPFTARAVRRRLLEAADASEPAALARARIAGDRALESLVRLGIDAALIDSERTRFAEFARTEIPAPRPSAPAGTDRRVPRRRIEAPLSFHRHLLPGWEGLSRDAREAWWALEREVPEAHTLFEIAWYGCDGRRSLADLVSLVEIETGRSEPRAIVAFFDYAARLGISDWI